MKWGSGHLKSEPSSGSKLVLRTVFLKNFFDSDELTDSDDSWQIHRSTLTPSDDEVLMKTWVQNSSRPDE